MSSKKTEWVFNDEGNVAPSGSSRPLPRLGGDGQSSSHDPTAISTATDGAASGFEDSAKTQIAMSYPEPERDAEGKTVQGGANIDKSIDPVVGWLVVTHGPGKGQAVQIGAGNNSIGRDPSERIALPFGDMQISAKSHASLIYDPSSRSFFISHQSGTNLTRLNGKLVANLVPMSAGDTIDLGDKTRLRFMPFCGSDFDWSDAS